MSNKKYRFGLVGKNISYSFSKGYFTDKFSDLGLDGYSYENFDLQSIEKFPEMLRSNPDLLGLNVTIPYKREVMSYLDGLDAKAKEIGAVNTIQFDGKRLIGHNTDAYGFQKSIEPFLQPHHTQALILGTGGASKAIAFVFGQLGIAVNLCVQKSRSTTNRIWRSRPNTTAKPSYCGQLHSPRNASGYRSET